MEAKKWLLKKSLLSRKKTINEIKDKTSFDTKIVDEVFIENNRVKRLRLSLNYKSCKVKTCSMCPFPNDGANFEVSDDELLTQIKNGLKDEKNIDLLTLYHNGNFFADNEIKPSLRKKIYQLINNYNIKYFAVESLPQTITEEKLIEFKSNCENIKLQIAIGVQTMDSFLREYSIISPFKDEDLDNALFLIKKFKYEARVFLMFGMPFIDNNEALNVTISDVIKIKEQYDLEETVVICPLVSVKNTLAYDVIEKEISKDIEIREISVLIDKLVELNLHPKITFNSSVYEYKNDELKRREYLLLKDKISDFNQKLMINETKGEKEFVMFDKEQIKRNVLKKIDDFILINK